MTLIEQLQNRLADGMPFGFCPWEDGVGMAWGSLVALKDTGFQVQLIGTMGEIEEVEWRKFDEVYAFDFGVRYSERLQRLRDFVPTLPDQTGFYEDAESIERILREVFASNSVARIHFNHEDSNTTVRVLSIVGEWVTMQDYDDLMQPYGLISHRLDNITGIRTGTAYEEVDEFLSAIAESSVK